MMFAIAVDLLSGRYTATRFNDRSEPEWPPHPARLFSAMTAAWADDDEPDPQVRGALRWLEEQPAPSISCSEARHRAVVTHFVPVNDATALARDVSRTFSLMAEARLAVLAAQQSGDDRAAGRAGAALAKAEAKAIADAKKVGQIGGNESRSVVGSVLEVLPENRGKQGRTYPTVVPDQATFWFTWADAEPTDQHRDALDRVLAKVGRIGHSSTLVSCRCVAVAPPPTWIPAANGGEGERVRVPRSGLINRLELAFQSHRGSEPRLLPAGMTGYRRPSPARPKPAVPLLGGDWLVLGVKEQRKPAATLTLSVAKAARNALLNHGDQPLPEILSGHCRSGTDGHLPTRPLDRPHLAVVPLPNAGHPYSDGRILGIALILPADCSDLDRSAVERALRRWSAAGFALNLPGRAGPSVRYTLEDLGADRAGGRRPSWVDSDIPARRQTTTRSYWCRPARRWLTVTPIALDRFPGNLRSSDQQARERAEGEAEASVARACSFAGLPGNPIVAVRLDSPLTGLPDTPAGRGQATGFEGRRFPRYQTGSGVPRVCVHAEIEFNEPVSGPVLIGAGRYFGYGLCLPSDMAEDRS